MSLILTGTHFPSFPSNSPKPITFLYNDGNVRLQLDVNDNSTIYIASYWDNILLGSTKCPARNQQFGFEA
ncbi:hypothetical protein MMC27_004418 [Xylographa pallens]|nr:hypothetical protein [Xylographa pallens]